jgi:hypothetical protein
LGYFSPSGVADATYIDDIFALTPEVSNMSGVNYIMEAEVEKILD